MFKKIRTISLVALLSFNGLLYAAPDKDTVQLSSAITEREVLPVKPLKNYFVNNTFPDDGAVKLLRITSQSEMESVFGQATLMGEGGQPTKVDFAKEQLIAVIAPASQTIVALTLNSLVKNYNQINLNYHIEEAESNKSYTSRHYMLLSIDKQFKGRIVVQRDNLPGGDLDEFGCKPSTGYFWSSIKKRCVAPGDQEDLLILSNGTENIPIIFNKQRTLAEVIHLQFDNCPYNIQLKGGKIKGKVLERWKGQGIVLERTGTGYKLYKDGRLLFN